MQRFAVETFGDYYALSKTVHFQFFIQLYVNIYDIYLSSHSNIYKQRWHKIETLELVKKDISFELLLHLIETKHRVPYYVE